MNTGIPAVVAAAFLCAGCYATREVVLTEGERLPADTQIREVVTREGERIGFTEFSGQYGVIEDSVVTGISGLQGSVRIPVSRIRMIMVREFDTFTTVLGASVAAAGAWMLVNRILAASGDDGGTTLTGCGPATGGGSGGGSG